MLILLVFIIFLSCLLLGTPIFIVIGLCSYIPMMIFKPSLTITLVQRMFQGMDSFPLMAIPLFILSSEVMSSCGITQSILDIAKLFVGKIRGGLGHVNVVASMLFAGISGSGLADAAGLGPIEIQMMRKAGYDDDISCAITAASAVLGPIIPPSILAVLYAVSDPRVSVAAIFIAGFIPGILIGLGLMIIIYFQSLKRNFPLSKEKYSFKDYIIISFKAFPALLMPLIIIGGILTGTFTPTEAAGVAVFYALIIGFIKRSLHIKELPGIFIRTCITTSVVLLIIGVANSLTWILVTEQLPQTLIHWFNSMSNSPIFYLLFANLILFLTGAAIDISAALIILVPILAPTALALGINPLHFAVVLIVNLSIGMITPPVGNILFITSTIGKISYEKLIRAIIPYLVLEIIVVFIITYVPDLVLWLPKMIGLQ